MSLSQTKSPYLPLRVCFLSPSTLLSECGFYRPDFADLAGQVLGQRDSELLLSYLTVPYIRVPLVLRFFASEDRVSKLRSKNLQRILDSATPAFPNQNEDDSNTDQ